MKRARELLAFLLGASIATLLTVLIGRGQNPDFGGSIRPSAAESALNQTLYDVQIGELPLDTALMVLSDKAHVPIILAGPRILQATDINVTLRAREVTLETALRQILEPVNTLKTDFTFWPDKDAVRIGRTNNAVMLRVYDLQSLHLNELPTDSNPDFGGIRNFLVVDVAPETWRENGGTFGTLGFLGSKMIVAQTWENQQIIGALLHDLEPAPMGVGLLPGPQSPSRLWVWRGERNRFEPATQSVAEAALRRELPEVNISQRPLEEALATLGEQAHVTVLANWRSLEGTGVDRTGLVTLKARDIPLALALKKLVPTGTEQVAFMPEGALVCIDTVLRSRLIRVYDLRGYFSAPADDRAKQTGYSNLMNAIRSTIAPGGWDGNASEGGMIGIFDSKLVVGTDWWTQEAIADLLADLHRSSTTQPASR